MANLSSPALLLSHTNTEMHL